MTEVRFHVGNKSRGIGLNVEENFDLHNVLGLPDEVRPGYQKIRLI